MDNDALERSLGGSAQPRTPLEVLSQIEGSFQHALHNFCYTQLASQVSPHQDYQHCLCSACMPIIRSTASLLVCALCLASLLFAALSKLAQQLADTDALANVHSEMQVRLS